MVSVTCAIELLLSDPGFFDGAFFDPLDFDMGTTWRNVVSDVRLSEGVSVEYGIRGNSPLDRVANAGVGAFGLNNSENNSAATLGYYSLLSAARRAGFDLNIPVRVSFSSPSVAAGTSYYKFVGRLDTALPDAGINDERMTHCTALDIWDDFATNDEPDVPLQTDKRADEIVTALLDAADAQPTVRSIETGSETYTYALDGGTGQKLKIRERLNQLAMSEFGYCYSKGDSATGDVFVFESRHHRSANPTVMFTLSDDMDRDGVVVPGSRADVVRAVQVTVHPTNNVSTTSPLVLWSLQTASALIPPGATNDTIFGAYFDPITKEQIGGSSPSPTYDPVATTDYLINSAADGTGSDLTADFTVTASRTGLGVRWTITNNGGIAGYVTKLQVSGIPIYRYDTLIEHTVSGAYGKQVLALDMPFQNNTNVGVDVATVLTQRFEAPFAQVSSVRFLANRSASHLAAALQLEPGDRIAISETVTGLSSHVFTINGVRLEYAMPDVLWCTWYLEAATNAQYWLLGTAGFSELEQTTILGF